MVGLGHFGKEFVRLFRDHPGVDKIALCDAGADRPADCAQESGIAETYTGLDEICRSDLDVLVIVAQHCMHVEHVMQALDAGEHVSNGVLPACATEGDNIGDKCGSLVEHVRCTGLTCMLGATTSFRAETVHCRRRAAVGNFGRSVYSEGEYIHDWSHGLHDVYRRRSGRSFGLDMPSDLPSA